MYLSGYRWSAMAAARANSFIGPAAQEYAHVEYAGGTVLLFKTKEGPRTVLATRLGILWRAPDSTYFSSLKPAPINTVGWMSSTINNHPITVVAVVVRSSRIKTVEVGPIGQRESQSVRLNTPLLFSWNRMIAFNDMNPLALSHSDKPIYEYRYPQNTSVIHPSEIKWYPVKR